MAESPNETATQVRMLPIHLALVRPILLGGADRELTLLNAIVCFALVFGIGLSRWTIGLVAVLATGGQWTLGRVTRYDPDFRRVYSRHVLLQTFYPASVSIHAAQPVVHAAVPLSE